MFLPALDYILLGVYGLPEGHSAMHGYVSKRNFLTDNRNKIINRL